MMDLVNILVAAVAAYAFGSVWYMLMARPWMNAAGLSDSQINRKNPVPYLVSFVSVLVVSAAMQFLFSQMVVLGIGQGLILGAAVGLLIVLPWIATNYTFGLRPVSLILIDGTYAVAGCAIIGLVLSLF